MSEGAFKTAQARLKQRDFQGACEAISSVEEKDLFLRLVEARLAEESRNLESAESLYMDILESFASVGAPCPLGLLHFLGFVSRTQGTDASLSLFDDLYLAESEHLTPELYPAVAVRIAWSDSSKSKLDRLNSATEVFRKGLARLKGSRKAHLIIQFSEFLALNANELKQSQLELSNAIAFTGSDAVWKKWEDILVEFNADLDTIKGMFSMRKGGESNSNNQHHLVEDLGGIVTLSDKPSESAAESWLLNKYDEYEKVIKTITDKLRIDSIWPQSAVLESVLGMPEKNGALTGEEEEDLRDGGIEPTNHVYRPDVTKMLKFVPQDEVERKVQISNVLKNFIALLPTRPLRHANAQYVAEQCVRLMVSITLPPRVVTEEIYANVDKRTKASYEQKYVRHVQVAAVPVLATKEKDKEEETAQRVKKEEIFDPVEYYNKK